MNSLPLISHHLFVAAVASLARAQTKPACRQVPGWQVDTGCRSPNHPSRAAADVPLEVLADTPSLPVFGTRPLRVSAPLIR